MGTHRVCRRRAQGSDKREVAVVVNLLHHSSDFAILSPWPSRFTLNENNMRNYNYDWGRAVTRLALELGITIPVITASSAQAMPDADAQRIQNIDRLGEVCAAIVEKYAPSAPDGARTECLIRIAGWLRETASVPQDVDFGQMIKGLHDSNPEMVMPPLTSGK